MVDSIFFFFQQFKYVITLPSGPNVSVEKLTDNLNEDLLHMISLFSCCFWNSVFVFWQLTWLYSVSLWIFKFILLFIDLLSHVFLHIWEEFGHYFFNLSAPFSLSSFLGLLSLSCLSIFKTAVLVSLMFVLLQEWFLPILFFKVWEREWREGRGQG